MVTSRLCAVTEVRSDCCPERSQALDMGLPLLGCTEDWLCWIWVSANELPSTMSCLPEILSSLRKHGCKREERRERVEFLQYSSGMKTQPHQESRYQGGTEALRLVRYQCMEHGLCHFSLRLDHK